LLLAGFAGPRLEEVAADLLHVGAQVKERRVRLITQRLKRAANQRSMAASTIAGLIGGKNAEDILQEAQVHFRCVDWTDLRFEMFSTGGLSNNGGVGDGNRYRVSHPCELGRCDAFLSHSWRDDVILKWRALRKWCERFQQSHSRSPTLWIDKLCIDQAAIARDLLYLPVFLAACNRLLVLSGPTYTSRLWCVMELYVYISMNEGNRSHRNSISVVKLCEGAEHGGWGGDQKWKYFDAADCECFDPDDKAKMISIFEHGVGGVEAFNKEVRRLMNQRSAIFKGMLVP